MKTMDCEIGSVEKKVAQGSQGIVQKVMAQERCMYGILKKGERRYIDE
jgi:hypothetical protein